MHRARLLALITLVTIAGGWSHAVAGAAKNDNDPSLRDYHSGNGLLNRGLYDLAIDEYRKFLDRHPNHAKAPTARYGLAVSLYRLKRLGDAATEFALLHDMHDFEFAAEVATILGQCYLAQGKYDDAAGAFKTVVDDHHKHDLADDAAAGWVEALYLAGRYDDALKRSRKSASKWSDHPLRDRVEYFRALSEMAVERYAAAADRLDDLIVRDADGPFAQRATLLLAQCRHHTGDLDQAAASYRRVIEQSAPDRLPDALFGLATILMQQSGAPDARELLDRLIHEFPDHPLIASALQLRGRVWFDLERFDSALKAFRQSAQKDAGLADRTAFWMAKCTLRQNKFDNAAKRLRDAIDEFPDSALQPEMHYDRAVALVQSEDLEHAAEILTRFLTRFPEHAMAADALYLLATTDHRRKNYDDSRQHCRAFLEQHASHPHTPAIAFLAAENEFLQARYEPAVDAYRRFLDRHPNDTHAARARHRAGTALYRLGRLDESQSLLAGAVSELGVDGALASNLLALGDIAFQRGEWKTAEQHLEHYLASTDDPPSADDALLKLGLARQRQDSTEDALAAYDELLARHKESAHRLQAVFERGQALLKLDRRADAAHAFEIVLADAPDSRFAPYARNHLGAIAIQNNDFETAAKHFDSVARSMTGTGIDANAAFQRGQALMGAQRFEEADAVFAEFIKSNADHPRARSAEAQRAIALARHDQCDDAMNLIKKIEKQRADRLDPALRAAIQYEKAWCLRTSGKTEDAAAAYRHLLDTFADDPRASARTAHAMLELASIEMDNKQYEAAADLLRRLRESRSATTPPDLFRNATYSLAVCEFERDRFRESADLFDEFLTDRSDDELVASASYFCGEALFRLDRHQHAVPHFTRVVERFDADPAFPVSLLRLGECQSVLQRWAKSEQRFTQYLDRFPDTEQWFQAMFGVGWSRENQQRHNDAIEPYQKVVDRHQGPTAARAQFQIGECLFAKKKYQEAVRELLKVDIHYAYPEWSAAALYEAGRCFEKLAKPVEAREQFKQVVTKYADTRWAQMAVQHLDAVATGGIPGR